MTSHILGVEIGGTKLQLAIGTPQGEIVAVRQGRVDVEQGGEGIRSWLERHIPNFIDAEEHRYGPITAIGCGFGGPINSHEGRVLQSVQIEGWKDFPLREWFQKTFSLPTIVANDSNAAAWGEYCLGFGKGSQNFFYTNIGSGIGGGLVIDGALYDGQGFGAGEFGHTYVPDWRGTPDGQAVEIESLCSGWAIENRLQQPGYIPEKSDLFLRFSSRLGEITARDLGDSAKRGDAFAVDEIDKVAHSIGIGLANVLNLTSVERIAIGGGVSNMGEILIEPIRKHTARYVFINSQGRYDIQQCQLGDEIVLVGAILIASKIKT